MNSNERSQLVLSLAEVLYTNGQSTEQVVTATERLGSAIGVRGRLLLRWDELNIPGGGSRRNTNARTRRPPRGG
jgi:hypothetical protein